MMAGPDTNKDPDYWRARAHTARAIANDLPKAETKRRMLKLADGYDALALKAERRRAETRTKVDEPK